MMRCASGQVEQAGHFAGCRGCGGVGFGGGTRENRGGEAQGAIGADFREG